ncbi:MAG: DUF4397 domain-containing protein [Flavobacteriales bacterium]|nr:DUF4397 domain-containing protein [Flavobacteriales bacterium]
MASNRTLLISAALLAATSSFAQARVQVIHNCADLAAATVDVWLDNTLLIDNFAFRTASSFIDAPSDLQFTVGIAPPNSMMASDAIYQEDFTLAAGGTYVIVASGIVSGSGYAPNPGFSLAVFAQGQEAATLGTNTDVLVYHGSTDAPAVDVYESGVLNVTAVDNASYGDYAGYLNLPTNDYTLQVRTADNAAIVATYAAPLQTLGLQGAALTVLASGFLNPANNSNGPAFGLYAALPSGGALVALPLVGNPTARVQVVHNCADLAASTVDVYLNDALLIDDFAFRTASAFIDAPATIAFNVGIAPASSTSSADAIYNQIFNLTEGSTYVVVAGGIVSGSGYTPNTPFSLNATDLGQEAATLPTNTDVLVYHGSTDAPTVDVFESGVLNVTAVDNASYGDFAGYLNLPTADYTVQVRTADNAAIVATYAAPLQTLGLAGAALTVYASGFLNPANNSNGPAFGLWVALPTGGALIPLPLVANPTARVQVIHNSADLAASTVDVWLDNTLLIDNFAFRTASAFIDAPATIQFTVGIAPANSTNASESIATFPYTLDEGGTYIITANGIVSGSGYNPPAPFNLYVKADSREAAAVAGNTDILVFHGATDAPVVDVAEVSVVNATLVNDLAYGSYTNYLEVPTNDYVLQVQLSDGTPVVTYDAPLATLGLTDAAITVLASGFLAPAQNSNGPAFGLWVALASGGNLVELPISTSISENIGDLSRVNVWPNPATDNLTVALDATIDTRTTVRISDIGGRVVLERSNTQLQQGENYLEFSLNDFSAGSYQLTIVNGNAARTLPLQVVR